MELLLINLVLAIPVFILTRFIFKKIKPSWSRLRSVQLWISTALITPLLYVGIVYVWILSVTYYPKRDFDRAEWEQREENRYEYADDLVDNKKLIGMSETEVEAMLGAPKYEIGTRMTYYLGFSPRHLFGIDPDWLEIELKDGKVVETRIIGG